MESILLFGLILWVAHQQDQINELKLKLKPPLINVHPDIVAAAEARHKEKMYESMDRAEAVVNRAYDTIEQRRKARIASQL